MKKDKVIEINVSNKWFYVFAIILFITFGAVVVSAVVSHPASQVQGLDNWIQNYLDTHPTTLDHYVTESYVDQIAGG